MHRSSIRIPTSPTILSCPEFPETQKPTMHMHGSGRALAAGPGRPLLALAVVLLVTCSAGGSRDILSLKKLQEKIIDDTKQFRGRSSCYRGHCGPWIEDSFFKFFQTLEDRDKFLPYIYLPVEWTLFAVAKPLGQRSLVDDYLKTLPLDVTYFTVSRVLT